jgi:hypothetical protein
MFTSRRKKILATIGAIIITGGLFFAYNAYGVYIWLGALDTTITFDKRTPEYHYLINSPVIIEFPLVDVATNETYSFTQPEITSLPAEEGITYLSYSSVSELEKAISEYLIAKGFTVQPACPYPNKISYFKQEPDTEYRVKYSIGLENGVSKVKAYWLRCSPISCGE